MKNAFAIRFLALVMPLMMFLSLGCPEGTEYPPANPGTERIDKKLLGTWEAMNKNADFKKFTISRKDDFSYQVEITDADGSGNYNSWVTKIGGKRFIYSQELSAENENPDGDETKGKEYFTYHYATPNKSTLIIHEVRLLVNGKDNITSVESFRQEIEGSLKMHGCLTNEWRYKKVAK
jgi:hypothetical protein